MGELVNSLVLPDHQKIINQHDNVVIAGNGATWQKCVMPLNYLKGQFQYSFLLNSKRSKGTESSTDQDETNLTILKLVRECYHSPYPIAHLIGQINQACTLVDDIECLALVDSGAQISTITVEFVKQLGLKIHQLDPVLKFETTGGGDIPYTGYVEVNLEIPEII